MVQDRIGQAIVKSGLKQKYIAEQIGVSEQTLSAMLAGRRKIYVDEFFNLCAVLNETPNNLYGFESAPQTGKAEHTA